jgi:hypothetical protein
MSEMAELLKRFPQVPTFRADWTPVYLEPILGSGEQLTVAIVVRAKDRAEIHPVIRPEALRALYGEKAKGIRGIVELAIDNLTDYLRTALPLEQWSSPISGVSLGKSREAASDDMAGILRQAIQLSASLSLLGPADVAAGEDESELQVASSTWTIQVREEIQKRRIDLLPYFNKSGKFFPDGEPVRFGFLGRGVVAQFGVLRPGKIQPSVREARARLWELNRARKITEIKNVGLILHIPLPGDGLYNDKEHEAAERNTRELRREAQEGEVGLISVHNPEQGAEELLRLAA